MEGRVEGRVQGKGRVQGRVRRWREGGGESAGGGLEGREKGECRGRGVLGRRFLVISRIPPEQSMSFVYCASCFIQNHNHFVNNTHERLIAFDTACVLCR